MRLRNVKGSKELISESRFVVQEPETKKGMWKKVFHNENPIYIEIGMGKGQFITRMAIENPDINYIGIEKYSSVLVRAIEKIEQMEINNLIFVRMDAEHIGEVFDKDEIDNIYLNFSDPWPKDRHAKRRLTSKEFFSRYDKILIETGKVEFKTDNRILFDFSLEEVAIAGWKIEACTFDLHHDDFLNRKNIMTEYEEKFSSQGHPIYKLIAAR